MKKIVLGIVGLACSALILTGCGSSDKKEAGDDWQKIKDKGEILIGVDDTFVPMGFRDEDNNLVGFDIELAQAVGEELGVETEFVPIDWSMKEAELENGTIDLIWNGYTVTEERKQKVLFTNYYLVNDQVLVSLKESNINSFKDMKDKEVGAQEGSSGQNSFENSPELMKDFVKNNEPVLYPTFTDAFMDLESKRIDGLIIDKVFAEYYISHQAEKDIFAIAPSEYEQENFAIGCRKDATATVAKINEALKAVYDNGKAKEISEKWFGEDRLLPQE